MDIVICTQHRDATTMAEAPEAPARLAEGTDVAGPPLDSPGAAGHSLFDPQSLADVSRRSSLAVAGGPMTSGSHAPRLSVTSTHFSTSLLDDDGTPSALLSPTSGDGRGAESMHPPHEGGMAHPHASDGPAPEGVSATTAESGAAQKQPRLAPVRLRNVYVAALPMGFSDTHLAEMLGQFGRLVSCRMFNDTRNVVSVGRSYGFGLFERPEDAEAAVQGLSSLVIAGRRVQIRLSDTNVVKKTKATRKAAQGVQGQDADGEGGDEPHVMPSTKSPSISSGTPSPQHTGLPQHAMRSTTSHHMLPPPPPPPYGAMAAPTVYSAPPGFHYIPTPMPMQVPAYTAAPPYGYVPMPMQPMPMQPMPMQLPFGGAAPAAGMMPWHGLPMAMMAPQHLGFAAPQHSGFAAPQHFSCDHRHV